MSRPAWCPSCYGWAFLCAALRLARRCPLGSPPSWAPPPPAREVYVCPYCGMEYGYHDKDCPQRDLTHLVDAP